MLGGMGGACAAMVSSCCSCSAFVGGFTGGFAGPCQLRGSLFAPEVLGVLLEGMATKRSCGQDAEQEQRALDEAELEHFAMAQFMNDIKDIGPPLGYGMAGAAGAPGSQPTLQWNLL